MPVNTSSARKARKSKDQRHGKAQPDGPPQGKGSQAAEGSLLGAAAAVHLQIGQEYLRSDHRRSEGRYPGCGFERREGTEIQAEEQQEDRRIGRRQAGGGKSQKGRCRRCGFRSRQLPLSRAHQGSCGRRSRGWTKLLRFGQDRQDLWHKEKEAVTGTRIATANSSTSWFTSIAWRRW